MFGQEWALCKMEKINLWFTARKAKRGRPRVAWCSTMKRDFSEVKFDRNTIENEDVDIKNWKDYVLNE